MSKELEALQSLRCAVSLGLGTAYEEMNNKCDIIESALKEKEKNDFELEVFKLAYEWKCNGVKGTYEEVLEQAKRTVDGWNEINKKDYGTIIDECKQR